MDLGLQRAGFSHAFFCESDSYRRSVLAARFPGVPIYDDVRTLDFQPTQGVAEDGGITRAEQAWRYDSVPVLDLLAGGFPCTDLSYAGKRAGLAGDKSGLFFEFARIADALRPRFILIENVVGLLTSERGRDFGVVLETLANIGYVGSWRVCNGQYWGVPQRRRRVFILGTVAGVDPRGSAERCAQILAVGESCGRHTRKNKEARKKDSRPSISGIGSGGADDNDAQNGRLVARSLRGSNGNGRGIPASPLDAGGELIHGSASVRRLTPREYERLMGFPDDWTNPYGNASDSRRYSACGDAVITNVAEWIGKRLFEANKKPQPLAEASCLL